MFELLKKIRQKYQAPEDVSEIIHKRNRFHLRFVFGFSVLFGMITLIVFTLKERTGSLQATTVMYYLYYIIVGIIGLSLCFTKSGKLTPSIAVFAFFGIICGFYFLMRPISTAILYYVGFMFFMIILFDYNPFVLAVSVILYQVLISILIICKVRITSETVSVSNWINMFLTSACIIYLAFWKRSGLLKKFSVEKSIEQEKNKSEELLLNLLPRKVMEQLRDTGKASPEHFDETTVLFAEIVNFTELSEKLAAPELVKILNEVFGKFDAIVEKNSCVRIKTTGEIYMAVCGLPVKDEKHAEHIIFCAKQFIRYIEEYNQTAENKIYIRVGLNSGKVIAGIVGIKKYIYDIFGDTVNTASRMESMSSKMQINISENTYNLVKDKFLFKKQSPIQVKGKGTMQTYLLDEE